MDNKNKKSTGKIDFYEKFKSNFDKSFSLIEPEQFVSDMVKLGYKFKTIKNKNK
jgi:hypothetical protein